MRWRSGAYKRYEQRIASDAVTAKVKRNAGPTAPTTPITPTLRTWRQNVCRLWATARCRVTSTRWRGSRLARHEDELIYEYQQRSDEGLRVRRSVIDSYRNEHGTDADKSDRALRDMLQTRTPARLELVG